MNPTMKKYLFTLVMTAFGFGTLTSMQAQDKQKIGHINADELLSLMPETDSARSNLQLYQQQLENDLTTMQTELQQKIQNFRQNQSSYTTLTLESKTQEIQQLQERIGNFQQRAQEDLQDKQVELFEPIIEKATNAVQEVAKENGFTYILDTSQSKAVVIFAENGIDIMPMVKKKLGLQ